MHYIKVTILYYAFYFELKSLKYRIMIYEIGQSSVIDIWKCT